MSFKRGFINNIRLSLAIIVFISVIIWQGLILFPALILYVFWSLINWIIKPDRLELTKDRLSSFQGEIN